MKFSAIFFCMGLVFICMSVNAAAIPDKPKKDSPDVRTLVKGNTTFAFDLYAKLKTSEGNLFFSPYSISAALGMTYAGAKGDTQVQMSRVLHFIPEQAHLHRAFSGLRQKLSRNGSEISIANALWGQGGYPFRKDFVALLAENYGAGLNEVNFREDRESARQTINSWVEKQTRAKIRNLIRPGIFTPLTRLVLTNAIYFKGVWASPFEKERTKEDSFMLSDGREIRVPMMQQKGVFRYAEKGGIQVLELPYEDSRLSMVILLPRSSGDMTELENSMTPEKLNLWLPERQRDIIVFLPKFRLTSEFEMAEVLKSMGMRDAFDQGKADFSGMYDRKNVQPGEWLSVSKVIHKAFADVNEEGTEAAAATAAVMRTRSMPPVFRADHPFVFFIRDNASESILFFGRVVNPGE